MQWLCACLARKRAGDSGRVGRDRPHALDLRAGARSHTGCGTRTGRFRTTICAACRWRSPRSWRWPVSFCSGLTVDLRFFDLPDGHRPSCSSESRSAGPIAISGRKRRRVATEPLSHHMAERRALWVSTSMETRGGIATYVREMQQPPVVRRNIRPSTRAKSPLPIKMEELSCLLLENLLLLYCDTHSRVR